MCFLLRTDYEYRLCYSEPKRPYVKDRTGTLWCAKEYEEMFNQEHEVEAHTNMLHDFDLIDGWADVSENNGGLVVSKDIAEYMLQGEALKENEFVELSMTCIPVYNFRGDLWII